MSENFVKKPQKTTYLPSYDCNEEIFNKIFEICKVKYVDNIADYCKPREDKWQVYADANTKDVISIQAFDFSICSYLCGYGYVKSEPRWKLVTLKLVQGQKEPYKKTVSGLYAYNYMLKILEKYYSKEEIEEILDSYTDEYSESLKQVHMFGGLYNTPTRHENCFYYDLNSAYGYELMQVFPRAREAILKLYRERKDKPNNKLYLNYFIGFCKRRGKDGFYNHIVQAVSRKIKADMLYTKGQIIYANTDGFIVKAPKNILHVCHEIGEWKLEYQGDIWTYQDKNYCCYQWFQDGEKVFKGSVRVKVRENIDLSVGKVVHYDNVIKHRTDSKGNLYTWQEIENITEEII